MWRPACLPACLQYGAFSLYREKVNPRLKVREGGPRGHTALARYLPPRPAAGAGEEPCLSVCPSLCPPSVRTKELLPRLPLSPAQFSDFAFIVGAAVVLGNIVSILVFKKRIF